MEDVFFHHLLEIPTFYTKKRQTVATAVSAFLFRLEKSLTLATGTNLDYYKKVIDNCKYYIHNSRNPIIEFDLSNRDFLYKLFDICGYPTIEDNNTYYPPLNADGKPYIECAALLGKELIIKRMQATQTTICPRFEKFCKNKQYTNEDPITPECQCEQWKRNGPPCLMSAAFHYYELDNHIIIQKILISNSAHTTLHESVITEKCAAISQKILLGTRLHAYISP